METVSTSYKGKRDNGKICNIAHAMLKSGVGEFVVSDAFGNPLIGISISGNCSFGKLACGTNNTSWKTYVRKHPEVNELLNSIKSKRLF